MNTLQKLVLCYVVLFQANSSAEPFAEFKARYESFITIEKTPQEKRSSRLSFMVKMRNQYLKELEPTPQPLSQLLESRIAHGLVEEPGVPLSDAQIAERISLIESLLQQFSLAWGLEIID